MIEEGDVLTTMKTTCESCGREVNINFDISNRDCSGAEKYYVDCPVCTYTGVIDMTSPPADGIQLLRRRRGDGVPNRSANLHSNLQAILKKRMYKLLVADSATRLISQPPGVQNMFWTPQ